MKNFYIALVHAPVYTRTGEVSATSVTHIDIHDIARTARTYGASGFYLVTPWKEQHELIKQIIGYWNQDGVKSYHPDRSEAFEINRLVYTVEDMIEEITQKDGQKPWLIATGAKERNDAPLPLSAAKILETINSIDFTQSVVLVLGTGWGLHESIFKLSDCVMDPIRGKGTYNHLSVRAACAILCDRLFERD